MTGKDGIQAGGERGGEAQCTYMCRRAWEGNSGGMRRTELWIACEEEDSQEGR